MARDQVLNVEVTGGRLVISVGLDTLKTALEARPHGQISYYDEEFDEHFFDVITDIDTFVAGILQVLHDEQEDGSTPVHRMLDEAAEHAIESGASGYVTKEDVALAARKARHA